MKLALLGDIALNGLFVEDSKNNGKRFAEVEAQLKDIDFVVANLETPIKSDNINQHKVDNRGIILSTTHIVLKEVLPLLNIKHLSLANNHSLDFSNEGLDATIKVLDELGITYSGVDTPYTIIEFDHIKIAFLSSVCLSTNPLFPIGNNRINIYDFQSNIDNINYIKTNNLALKIIVSIHWGVDYSHYPTEKQILEARAMIDAGADIIWGHHPHVMQPYEKYRNGLIFYSLGQLCFGDFINNYGMMTSFRRNAKYCFVPILNLFNNDIISAISLKEIKFNFIINSSKCYYSWNRRKKFIINLVKNTSFVMHLILLFDKNYYKISNVLFGYYRNPFKTIYLFFKVKLKK